MHTRCDRRPTRVSAMQQFVSEAVRLSSLLMENTSLRSNKKTFCRTECNCVLFSFSKQRIFFFPWWLPTTPTFIETVAPPTQHTTRKASSSHPSLARYRQHGNPLETACPTTSSPETQIPHPARSGGTSCDTTRMSPQDPSAPPRAGAEGPFGVFEVDVRSSKPSRLNAHLIWPQ